MAPDQKTAGITATPGWMNKNSQSAVSKMLKRFEQWGNIQNKP